MSFDRDFGWQRRFIPRIKQVLAEHLVVEAPFEEDARHNTDLIVLKLDTVRVACRLRRSEYAQQYAGEFTIRTSRPSGAETELAKVLSGWGDYIFYGFANPSGPPDLTKWILGDLNVFRLWHHRTLSTMPSGRFPGTQKRNFDGSSEFRAYRIDDLPQSFLRDRQPNQAEAGAA
jgi:hypothetical protein